jgi:hypothetical protein
MPGVRPGEALREALPGVALGPKGRAAPARAIQEPEPFCADVLHVLHDRRLQAESSRGRVCHSVLILIYACSKINMKNTIIAVS